VKRRASVDPRDPVGVHALRISYKRVRYVAELFQPLDGHRAAMVAKHAARMQKKLGEIHDIDVALATIVAAPTLSRHARASVLWGLGKRRLLWSRSASAGLEAELDLLLALLYADGS